MVRSMAVVPAGNVSLMAILFPAQRRNSVSSSGAVKAHLIPCAKASAGAVEYTPVARVSSLAKTIDELKKKNIWVYGAEADGQPFHKADLSGAVALVIGSEGFGLGRLVRERCDMILSIDMYGKVNSLNASVSGGILMYEVVRHRR